MGKQVNIKDYVLGDDEEVAIGDKLRVRPWQPPAKVFGQGTNPGPRFGDVQLEWGKPVKVTETGKVQPALVEQHRRSFMREEKYQEYQSNISKQD